jgi:AAA domain
VTSILRIDAVELDTAEGTVRYEFPSDLTVLAGPTGVGKTTLLEMIKYGLGCTARLAPVATDHVRDVTVEITIGSLRAISPPSRLRITRSIDQQKNRTARVTDLAVQERLPDHQNGDGDLSLSSLLMSALGLPADMRAASRTTGSSNAGNRITFADVMTFLYVRQAEINHDIAHSQDSYREPKRKAVFELLYGLTNPAILQMRSDLNALNAKVATVEAEYQNVVAFLRDSQTAGRTQVERDIADARAAEAQAEADQAALREVIDPVTDRETLTLRDLLTSAERALADARHAVTSLDRQQADYSSERRRVQADLDRYRRMLDAGERLASIEFSLCPRCMQSLTERHVPDGACRVCLQPDPVAVPETEDDLYETRQLRDQIIEMDGQLASTAAQLATACEAVADREQLVKRLSAVLDERTAQRVSPRLQAFSDAVQRLAIARTRQRELEVVLRQWDRADDIGASAERLRADRERLRSELESAQASLDNRRREILDALNDEFRETVRALGIPGIQTAGIHPTNYLPILNGRPFVDISSGGGIITAVQVAYWTSLLAVALRHPDTAYPALLIIDSPRMALNDQEALPAALYRRLVTQADASPGQVQFIIADNQLPAAYRRDYDEIDFTYHSPTVSTIEHPGPDAVDRIEN